MSEIYIYGGTLDPIHSGHIGVIREILRDDRAILVAPTTQNPWKSSTASPLKNRLEMIEIVFLYEGLPLSATLKPGAISLHRNGYIYAAELVNQLRKDREEPITWVTGPDIADEVTKWKDWNSLEIDHYVAKEYADNLRGTEIRKGDKTMHPALREYIKSNGLYSEK